MKKILFLSSLTMILFSASAQYLPMAEQGRTWYNYITSPFLGNFTQVYKIDGDTLMNGRGYSWLVSLDSIQNNPGREALIHEDTTVGLVEIIKFNRNLKVLLDTTYYDFSLMQGDTVVSESKVFNDTTTFVVDTVYYLTDFRNVSRKVLMFKVANPSNCQWQVTETWIEGVGGLSNLIWPLPSCHFIYEAWSELKCVFDSTAKIYGDTVSECYVLSNMENELGEFTIFPNPARDELQIQSELPLQQARIYSLSGTVLLQKEKTENFIDVSSLKPGVFVLEITDQDGNVGRYKVVKE